VTRIPIVAGNWKMNTTATTAVELVEQIIAAGIDSIDGVEKVVCPPYLFLPVVAELTRGTSLRVGAQNLHWEENGAFTGEVSPLMLLDFAEYVIIGHSERRAYFCETDETVNRKLRSVLQHGLLPIVCVGETGEQRAAGQTFEVLRRQVRGALLGIELAPDTVIAYEPVWAIGTGLAATARDANEAIAFVREQVASLQGPETAEAIRILYGGSVTPANIVEFVSQPEVDGGLVGGGSLVAASYFEMVRDVSAIV
jgi:triosephosphate isomerase